MHIILFQLAALLAVVILPVFVVRILRAKTRRKPKSVVKYKIDTDTTYARYAINESGFLEEINEGKLSKYKH
ncbi:hypothetical protein [Mucilaginibacter sp. FT3.2]|uniref:hypothetical protein n=1 Tax=Mucilaginibacter sp. FT3.2 TaxID=2723090 RepID=UPI00161F14E8|nr:hypothetical protein [Mucilaginibacter sp. FT3.2]MBB6229670.1 hypothetical protein [Mucilaginibacter sp. FT3.2]